MMKTVCLCACLLVLALPVAVFGAERVVEESFDVAPDARLFLESHKGEIKIRTADVSEVRMTARIYPDDGPAEDLDLVSIETSSGKGYVRIKVEYDEIQRQRSGELFKDSEGFSLPFVDFDIVMPDSGRLDLETHKSKIDVEAPSGEVIIETHKGEGRVTNVRGDFELRTHKGELDVEITEMGDIEIETHKGTVDLRVHGAADFSVRGQSHKGRISFDGYDIPIERGKDRELWISHTEGGGDHRIELETHKGEIRVEFLN